MLSPKLPPIPAVFPALCCLLLLLAGCASMHSLKENPKVSIADIRVRDVKAMETVFQIQLRILNPNDDAIDLHGINCEMEVDGRHFASGIADTNQSIPAFGTGLVTVNVYASVLDMVSSVVDLLHTGDAVKSQGKPMAYILKGTVTVGLFGMKKPVPFTTSGEVSLKGIGRGLKLPGSK